MHHRRRHDPPSLRYKYLNNSNEGYIAHQRASAIPGKTALFFAACSLGGTPART